MSEIKISVVMPMYNVEKYIGAAILSVSEGGLAPEEYELIVVNDGSNDKGVEVVDKLLKRDLALKRLVESGNWHYIEQENQGLSAARNVGCAHAKGKYLFFMDSDDKVTKGALSVMLDCAERFNLDVLRFNFQTVDEKGNAIQVSKNPKQYVDYSSEVVDGRNFLEKRLGYGCYAWQFLLRRELMEGCLFTPNIYFEDTDWTPRMLLKSKRVSSTERVLYLYTQRVGSIMQSTTQEKQNKLLADKISLMGKLNEWAKENGLKWYKTMTCRIALSIFNDPKVTPEKKQAVVHDLKSSRSWPLSLHHIPWLKSIRVALLNISPGFYFRFMVK